MMTSNERGRRVVGDFSRLCSYILLAPGNLILHTYTYIYGKFLYAAIADKTLDYSMYTTILGANTSFNLLSKLCGSTRGPHPGSGDMWVQIRLDPASTVPGLSALT